MTDKPMYVYLVEAVGADIIKIGVTVDVTQRVSDLQRCFPYQLRLLTLIPGGRGSFDSLNNGPWPEN